MAPKISTTSASIPPEERTPGMRSLSLPALASWFRPAFLLYVLLAIYLLAGLLLVTDYGESWDERLRYGYAQRSLAAYLGERNNLSDEKGPFYIMVALMGARVLSFLWENWLFIDAWHFMNFLSFLLGVFFFYRLSRRLVKPGPALATTLLFSTQPLLWGHAFINPKDIPFMAFFLGSVTLGLEMVDAYHRRAASPAPPEPDSGAASFRQQIGSGWRSASLLQRLLLILLGLLLLGLLLGNPIIPKGAAWILGRMHAAVPLADLRILFNRLFLPGVIGILAAGLLVANRVFPTAVGRLWKGQRFSPLVQQVSELFRTEVVVAGILLGFSSAIRVLGPASGLLVGAYFLLKVGRKAFPTVVVYLGIGAAVTYLVWPALWGAPVQNYLASSAQALNYPWEGLITFAGQEYTVADLPRSYLPVLLSLQFTETALVLFLVGAVLAAFQAWKNSASRLDLLLLAVWFLAPIGGAVIFRPTLYDNFRQFLFVIPPLFVLAGLGLQSLAQRVKNGPAFALVALALALPGLYWNFQLHPYQYIYYNSLVGGPQGAFRRFELDYWATSYKAAVEYLNQTAPARTRVVVLGPYKEAKTYARQGLVILKYPKPGEGPVPKADFIILSTRNNKDLELYPQAPVVFQVSRAGAILSVVKQISGIQASAP